MKKYTRILIASIVMAVILCFVFSLLQAYRVSSYRFSFSTPLHPGEQEIRAHLPDGRYCIVLNTNYDDRTFGLIPAQRLYTADALLEIIDTSGIIMKATNPHYEVFTVKNGRGSDLRIMVNVQNLRESDKLIFHLANSF